MKERTSESEKEKVKISKVFEKRRCNSCRNELPDFLDKDICPFCGRKN